LGGEEAKSNVDLESGGLLEKQEAEGGAQTGVVIAPRGQLVHDLTLEAEGGSRGSSWGSWKILAQWCS